MNLFRSPCAVAMLAAILGATGTATAVTTAATTTAAPAAAPAAGNAADVAAETSGACILAVITDPVAGTTIIDDRDADALRALLQPPPDRDAARRLAVDAALAHLWLRGWVAPASARGRLAAWRAFMEAVDTSAVPATQEVAHARLFLTSIAERAGLAAGPCLPSAAPARATTPAAVIPAIAPPSPRPESVLRREAGRTTLLRVEIHAPTPSGDRCTVDASGAPGGERGFDLGLVPASHLDADLARAALALSAGESSGTPIATRLGRRVIHLLERVDPRSAAAPGGHSPHGR